MSDRPIIYGLDGNPLPTAHPESMLDGLPEGLRAHLAQLGELMVATTAEADGIIVVHLVVPTTHHADGRVTFGGETRITHQPVDLPRDALRRVLSNTLVALTPPEPEEPDDGATPAG